MSECEEYKKQARKEGVTRFVVGAVVERSNTFLVFQRPENDFMGGMCELPSGKVEQGESLMQALSDLEY